MIVQSMVQKSSYGFGTFAGLRVGEVQQKTDPQKCLHICSDDNISDILTRGASPSLLGPSSIWQCGPSWLVLDKENWPATLPSQIELTTSDIEIERSFRVKSVCKSTRTINSGEFIRTQPLKPNLDNIISRISNLKKLIRTTALIMRVELCDFKIAKEDNRHDSMKVNMLSKIGEVTASEYADAWLYLIEYEQEKRLLIKNVQRLVPVVIEKSMSNYNYIVKLTVIGGRIQNFPIKFGGNYNIPILPASTLGQVVVSHYHNRFHKEVDTIVAHTRNDVWVINCRKFASAIDSRCKICIIGRNHRASQVMGTLPAVRSTCIAPAWSAVNMDLFGPIQIRDECIKRGPRVCTKVWGVVYACTRTRGVFLDIASDYSTESILHTVRRLLASKGQVSTIISDCGLQLQGADKEMRQWRHGWDSDMLRRFGADKGIQWEFVMPYSQHQNGAVEVLIKLVKGIKKSCMKAIGDTKLTYNEMNTMFLEIAQLCNERPIGLKPNLNTDPEFLSPNSLYLGRASDRISSGPFCSVDKFEDNPKSYTTRFHLVQGITNQFWKVWTKIFFPSLMIRQKWHTARRNLVVGDICLLQDSSALRGEWRLVIVTSVVPDKSGVVRNVEVKAKPKQNGSVDYMPSTSLFLKRHVSNLVVLVPLEEQKTCELKDLNSENDDK